MLAQVSGVLRSSRRNDHSAAVRWQQAHAAERDRPRSGLLEGLSRAITMKQKPYITHNEAAIEMLHEDPQFAAEYLNAVL
jgi:hypothetical protein